MTKVICAWCGASLGDKEGKTEMSQGICESCYQKELEKLKKKKLEEIPGKEESNEQNNKE